MPRVGVLEIIVYFSAPAVILAAVAMLIGRYSGDRRR
jgi:hypothetical protein